MPFLQMTQKEKAALTTAQILEIAAKHNIKEESLHWQAIRPWYLLAQKRENEQRQALSDKREQQLFELTKQANELVKETNNVMRQQRNVAIGALIVATLSIIASIVMASHFR